MSAFIHPLSDSITVLCCYNNAGENRVMITVKNSYIILNDSLSKLSKPVNELCSSFSEIMNNSLYKFDFSLKSNPENKIKILPNKVLLLDAKKETPKFH